MWFQHPSDDTLLSAALEVARKKLAPSIVEHVVEFMECGEPQLSVEFIAMQLWEIDAPITREEFATIQAAAERMESDPAHWAFISELIIPDS